MSVRRVLRIGLASLLCLVAIAGLWLYSWLFYDLPKPEDLSVYIASAGTPSRHQPVPLSEIPEELRWATIARYDQSFYSRPSPTLRNILRAIGYNLQYYDQGRCGGSISENLTLRLMSLSGKRVDNLRQQRMRELALTILITHRYTRDDILELYLNSLHYGSGVYGPEAAAQFYYGKPVRDLGLAECAMLEYVSWIPDLNPLGDLEEAKRGQALVLSAMVHEGCISGQEAQAALENRHPFHR